jgi:hypothetical protein
LAGDCIAIVVFGVIFDLAGLIVALLLMKYSIGAGRRDQAEGANLR